MWEWIKRSSSTDTHLRRERRLTRQLQVELSNALRESQAMNRQLTEALDRVIVSRFDPPVKPQPMAQPVRATHPDLTDMLSVEDDAEFLEKMESTIE